MIQTFQINTVVNYTFIVLNSKESCEKALEDITKNKINIGAFDTETDTKIDMQKRDGSNINLGKDLPFLLQFGYGNMVYIGDLEVSDEITKEIFKVFDAFCKKATLLFAHNVEFDVHMLWNKGYIYPYANICDSQTVARLALDSKSEREGGYPMRLKPLAARLLGADYAELGHEVDDALREIWGRHLKRLQVLLKPFGISRARINETLKDVTGTLDGYPMEVRAIWARWIVDSKVSYKDVDKNLMLKYGAMDVVLVLELVNSLLTRVANRQMIQVMRDEMRLIMPLVRMERTGYTVDKKYLMNAKQALIFEINGVKEINEKILGVSLTANQHTEIKKHIYDKFGYVLTTTDKNTLHLLINQDATMPEEVKQYLSNVVYLRTLEKFISTYINGMLYRLEGSKDNKVYTQFNPSGAISGRFTSNFQQFPKEGIQSKLGPFQLFHPRKMFIVESEEFPVLAYIDYSQIELRIQANYTYECTNKMGDINMLRAYMPFRCVKVAEDWMLEENPTQKWEGTDVHTQTTHMAFPEIDVTSSEFKKLRNVGKKVNFSIIYGASLRKVQATLADTPKEVVERLYYGFHKRFKDVSVYQRWVKSQYVMNGYATNMLGRRYYIEDFMDAYKLNNYLIQGSAADIFKRVLIKLDEYIRENEYKSKLQGCIHDEVCFVIHKDEINRIEEFKQVMESAFKMYVPLVAEISTSTTNWSEKH